MVSAIFAFNERSSRRYAPVEREEQCLPSTYRSYRAEYTHHRWSVFKNQEHFLEQQLVSLLMPYKRDGEAIIVCIFIIRSVSYEYVISFLLSVHPSKNNVSTDGMLIQKLFAFNIHKVFQY